MNIDELCRDVLAASEGITALPWRVDDAKRLVLSTAGKRVISEIEMADGGSKKIGADESYIVAACNAAPALARECIRLQRRVEELGAKVVQMRSFMRNILDGEYTQTQLIEAAKISLGGVDSPKEPRQ